LLAARFENREHDFFLGNSVRTGFFQSILLMVSGETTDLRPQRAPTGVLMTAGQVPVKKRKAGLVSA